MHRAQRTFIGVDLGGGKGKTTAVARLRLREPTGAGEAPLVVLDECDSGPWYDERLLRYLRGHAGEAVVAIDAPLTLPVCVRCTLPVCPGSEVCDVDVVAWFRARAGLPARAKPRYTPYTQRVTEVLLHEDYGILPRETLGQGMGPLTARGAYLVQGLRGAYQLNRDLLEVYPKATLARLFPDPGGPAAQGGGGRPAGPRAHDARLRVVYRDGNGREQAPADAELPRNIRLSRVARHYKRSGHAALVRETILRDLPGLQFGPGQWREFVLQNDHLLDALICAYTAYLWARDGWQLPPAPEALRSVVERDGWIWYPGAPGA